MVYREEFIDRLSKRGYSKLEADSIIDNIIGVLKEALANGESVLFHGFGKFEVRDRAERKAVDLQNNDIRIPAYRAVHFTPGKTLKREIQTGSIEW